MFKNLKMSVKLIGGFGIVVLMFAGVRAERELHNIFHRHSNVLDTCL